ncbi:MAG: alpha-ketoglutarate-dependent dioxygenase AlkB [Rhodobacteraceae bacterium]|nr:alpha-ketoglutarate-dependent dioxygenase AlkB [Paracoccaceae bacterium]
MQPTLTIRDFELYKGHLSPDAQCAVVDDIREVLRAAPLVQPVTPSGKPMSVRMSAAGRLGWITDRKGYRYAPLHPNGSPWPAIPQSIAKIWKEVTGLSRMPDCCLINWYGEDAKMGMHQDADEGDFSWPVLSISLGDEALFRMGNTERGGKTESVWLTSGDVLVMGGEARLKYHGVDRVKHGSSTLLKNGGRINLTLRVVDLAE